MMRWLLVAASVTLANAVASKLTSLVTAGSYEDFRRRHGHRRGSTDSVSYEKRRELYHARLAHIVAHNSQKRSWTAALNKFADYTNEELSALLGYKRWARSSHGPTTPSSFLQLEPMGELIAEPSRVAAEVDWRPKLTSSQFIRDQGSCGSCWAVATVGALEMQSELKSGNTTQLSFTQLVDCVANPKHCGGTGGCEGATAELAFEYVQHHGLGGQDSYQPAGIFSGGSSCKGMHKQSLVSLDSWQRLPVNEVHPLLKSVANHGPVVVSVDGGKWMPYESGVFDSCEKDSTVNHAVLTVGFGSEGEGDDKKLYWLIRNSWGPEWGDSGFIRIKRHEGDSDYCGTDYDPKQGVGCDGGPAEIPICGMCGVLSDSSHPVGAVIHT